MGRFKLNWYREDLELQLDQAADDYCMKVAMQMVGQTVANIVGNDQIDTGAMVNSVYAAGRADDTYGQKPAGAPANNGEPYTAPRAPLESGSRAAVAVGVHYAIYQEVRRSFLMAAAEMVAGQVAGVTIQKVARRRGLVG